MSDHVFAVTDDSFDNDVLQSDVPVIVDFWAEWCGPCKMIAPIYAEVAEQFAGRVKFVKLNIDDNNKTAPKYGVRGIPTLIMLKDGEVEGTKVGALTKAQLAEFVEANI